MSRRQSPWRRLPRSVRLAVGIAYAADRRAVFALVGTSVAITCAGVAQLAVIRDALGMFFGHGRSAGQLWFDVAGIMVCTSTLTVAAGLAVGRSRRLAEASVRQAQRVVLDASLVASLERFDEPDFHDSLSRALRQTYDVISVALGFAGAMTESFASLGFGLALLVIHPVLVPLIVLGYIPVFMASSRSSADLYSFNFDSTSDDRARSRLQEIMLARGLASEVRAFEMRRPLLSRWEDLFAVRMQRIGALVHTADRRYTITGVGSGALVALTCAVLGTLFQWGWISGAETAAAAIAIQQIGSRLGSMSASLAEIADHGVFLEEYHRFAATARSELRPEAPAPSVPLRPTPPLQQVRLDDVSFHYPGVPANAVSNVSLTLDAGEVIALVGENGSGKSTLAKLIAGLYAPQTGSVSWNGVPYDDLGETLRREIALLPQEFGRFPFTVAESVALGDTSVPFSDDAVARALDRAGASALVEGLERGVDTQLAREFLGGADLSGGQWQRIALARVFYRESAQLLVLDEPTAALDPRAELDLFTRIRELGAGRTVLYISHRFATVWQADRIAVLKDGQIAEIGSHQELLSLGGLYSELVELQRAQFMGQERGEAPRGEAPRRAKARTGASRPLRAKAG